MLVSYLSYPKEIIDRKNQVTNQLPKDTVNYLIQ